MVKKKIVHIVPSFGQGGVQTGMLYSMESLNKVYDYKILVITKMDEECKEWIKDLSPLLKTYIIDTDTTSYIKGWIQGYKILKQLKPDVIISSMWKSVGLSASYKFFNKNVAMAGFFHTSYSPHLPYVFFMKVMAYFQDTCLVDSSVTRDYVMEKYKIKNPQIIPYVFPFTKVESYKAFNPAKIAMAYFGIISPVKRVDRSLEFCRLCKLNGVNFIFDIYARGPVEEYNKKIAKLGLINEVTIKLVVPLQQVITTMQQYDFLLQLSDHEGMALSVVEAMNCGVVPIVTPVGEIARYALDGTNAILLDSPYEDNLGKLVDKLKKIVEDKNYYHQLSVAASGTFKQYKKYSDALIEAIDNYPDVK